jgi:Ca-activated chloride channel homolog
MMTDDLDALRAAMKAATPAPDASVRATTLRLALDNFDRAQESFTPARPTDAPPLKAGVFSGVSRMIARLTSRQMLAGTASVAAVCLGLVAVWPALQRGPVLPKETAPPTETTAATPDAAIATDTKTTSTAMAEGAPAATAPVAEEPMVTLAEPQAQPVVPPVVGLAKEPTVAEPMVTGQAPADATQASPPAEPEAFTSEEAPAAADERADSTAMTAQGSVTAETPPPPSAPLPVTPSPAAELAESDGFALARRAPAEPTLDDSPSRTRTVSSDGMFKDDEIANPPITSTERFATAAANPVKITLDEPVSTFSVDVDTASYAIIRQSIDAGQLPPPDAVRIEEMVNYFPYDYPAPAADGAPFQPTVTVMPTPWNFGTRLVHVALQGELPAIDDRPPLNLVFLIDTSGSMDEPNKLPLLQKALALMLGTLRPTDQVAIVAYAGSAGLVLEPTAASDTDAIYRAIDRLAAGGATAGAEGLELAYQIAAKMSGDGEVSRVLLATDGDFNVGISDPAALTDYVAQQRESGTYLSVLGFGRGNLDDTTMQALAQNGNGQAAYIDTLSEARKVLVDQVAGALFPIADDVKIQIEWNPAQVAEYRLIGYETRALQRIDFNNDRVDAGEIGAGLQVTAIYEVTAPGSAALLNDPLRYGAADAGPATGTEMGYLRLRYKAPGADTSQLIEVPIVAGDTAPSDDVRFAASIAGFGQLLTGATYLGDWGWDDAIALANGARGDDPYGYRIEAVNLMRLAKSMER